MFICIILKKIQLSHCIRRLCRSLVFAPGGNELVYCSQSLVIALDLAGSDVLHRLDPLVSKAAPGWDAPPSQRIFRGHSDMVTSIALSYDGRLMATAESGSRYSPGTKQ